MTSGSSPASRQRPGAGPDTRTCTAPPGRRVDQVEPGGTKLPQGGSASRGFRARTPAGSLRNSPQDDARGGISAPTSGLWSPREVHGRRLRPSKGPRAAPRICRAAVLLPGIRHATGKRCIFGPTHPDGHRPANRGGARASVRSRFRSTTRSGVRRQWHVTCS